MRQSAFDNGWHGRRNGALAMPLYGAQKLAKTTLAE
jgi:hypothetical protein